MRGFSRLGNSGGDISKGQTLAAAQNQNRRRGCGRKDSNKYWVNTDPMGVIMASVVWAISISTFFLMDSYVIQPWLGGWDSFWAVFARLWIGVIDVLNLTCHARAMLSNPGAVPKASKPVDASDYARHCHKCDHFKPKRAHHCSICGRCILKMDHHCPWVNNCVGLANMKYFWLFLLYNFSYAVSCLVLLFTYFLACLSPSPGNAGSCKDTTAGSALVNILLGVFGMMFALFTGCLMADQLNVALTNQTQIDRLKGIDHNSENPNTSHETDHRRLIWQNLGEVFGGDPLREGFQMHWLFPTAIRYKDPEALTGYCFREIAPPRTQQEMEMV